MARPGKTIFDVTMMAGWAFAAVLTGLVAMTMVEETGDSATDPTVLAARQGDDARIVTGSVPERSSPLTVNADRDLVANQNKSFNPFEQRAEEQFKHLEEIAAELQKLKREVAAFHVSTKRLREENDRLKQRLVKLELDPRKNAAPHVRVVELPKREDTRNPILSVNRQTQQVVDTEATGSIAPTPTVPKQGQNFNPFAKSNQPQVKLDVEPLNMDLTVEGPSGRMMLPRNKPGQSAAITPEGTMRPQSSVVATPQLSIAASQTSFALDLGQFISLSDLTAAWKEIEVSQRPVVGDLKPLSRVSQNDKNQLALNLVVGPIQNAAQAASLCAQLKFRGYACSVSTYQGQALASR